MKYGVVQEMIARLRSEASRHSISIDAGLTEGLRNVMADRVALQQVLMNLMLNAIDAMKEMGSAGKLTIATRQDDNRQLVDTGVGLPISRSIIESHGGRLWATHDLGLGATFQFTLPLKAAARQSA